MRVWRERSSRLRAMLVRRSFLADLYGGTFWRGNIRAFVTTDGSIASCDACPTSLWRACPPSPWRDYDAWGMQLEGRSLNSGQTNEKCKLRPLSSNIIEAEIPPPAGFTGKERDVETYVYGLNVTYRDIYVALAFR